MRDRAKRRLMRVCALGNLDRLRFPAGLGSRKGAWGKTFVETVTYETAERGLHVTTNTIRKGPLGNFYLILAIFINIEPTTLYPTEVV